jgi:hypothetical protein
VETITVGNFKYGLDTRREQLAAVPGTLLQIENAHINPGGEIEKREKFALAADLSVLDDNGDVGTFGLEATEVGLVTFGSALAFGTGVTLGQPVLVAAMPATYTYQQLQHPFVHDGGTYDPTLHLIDQIVCSCCFNGKAFVIAKFKDGNSFLYYDGDLIEQSRNGRVLEGQESLTSLALELEREIEDLAGWTATPTAGKVVVTSPAGIHFSLVLDYTTAGSGIITEALVDNDIAGVSGISASASFAITYVAGVGTVTVEAPVTAAAATPLVTLADAVVCLTDAATSAAAVVEAINARTSTTGYTAQANAENVTVYASAAWGNFTFDLVVTCTGTASDGPGTPVPTLFISVAAVEKEENSFVPKTVVTGLVTPTINGGVSPYTLLWEAVSSGGISINSPTGSSTKFSKAMTLDSTAYGTFKVTVTDSAMTTATAYFAVTLALYDLH